jgi:hypothetical protein
MTEENAVVQELDKTGTQVDPKESDATGVDPQGTAEQGENEQEKKRKGGWQRRQEKAERERDYWREQALRNAPKSEPEPKVEAKPKPVWKDYEEKGTQEQFFEDLADWKAEQKLAAFKAEQKAEAEKAKTQTEAQKQAERWAKEADEFRKEHSDFDEVIAQGNPSDLLSNLVARSKEPAKLAYHLANNPELEAQLSRMTDPVDVAQELGLIRAQLAQPKTVAEEPEEKPEPVISKAPKPPTPVSKPSPSAKPFDPNDEETAKKLTADEWIRKRNRQLRGQQ